MSQAHSDEPHGQKLPINRPLRAYRQRELLGVTKVGRLSFRRYSDQEENHDLGAKARHIDEGWIHGPHTSRAAVMLVLIVSDPRGNVISIGLSTPSSMRLLP